MHSFDFFLPIPVHVRLKNSAIAAFVTSQRLILTVEKWKKSTSPLNSIQNSIPHTHTRFTPLHFLDKPRAVFLHIISHTFTSSCYRVCVAKAGEMPLTPLSFHPRGPPPVCVGISRIGWEGPCSVNYGPEEMPCMGTEVGVECELVAGETREGRKEGGRGSQDERRIDTAKK